MTRSEILNQLKEYNDKIEVLLQERLEFMDSHMDEVSKYHVGDEYVNIRTGEIVTVKEIYRETEIGGYRGKYDDNSLLTIHAQFSNGDNTSRYYFDIYAPYCKKDDYDNKTDTYIKKLESCKRCKIR